MMRTQWCNLHHLCLVHLRPAFTQSTVPKWLPRVGFLTSFLPRPAAFHSGIIRAPHLKCSSGEFGLLRPQLTRRLGHTSAGDSYGTFESMDPEAAIQLENNAGHHQYRECITPTLSATIKCSGDIADELVEALMSFGASSVSIEDGNSGGSLEEQLYSNAPMTWDIEKRQLWKQSQLIALFPPGQDVEECLGFAFNSVGLTDMLPYEVKEVEHQNWIQQVKDTFQPLKIVDSLWIVPIWSSPPDGSATNVMLDPGLSFGTGDHPTTRLCLRWLNHLVKGGEYILDYGTGSGILAIAGLKMGAVKAVGVDIDPMAVSSAIHNASLNGFGSDSVQVFMTTICGDDPIPFEVAKFDIVVANILLNPLLELSTRISGYSKPGGLVGLSGILESQVEQVQERYTPYLENIQVFKDDGWACISGTRKLTNL